MRTRNSPYNLRRRSAQTANPIVKSEGNRCKLRRSVSQAIPKCSSFLHLPDEVLLAIFSYLLEQDLCRMSKVCKRFQMLCNYNTLWKRLYHSVFQYTFPLFNPEIRRYEFLSPSDCPFANPWKESFRQLYHGIHVRPGHSFLYKAKGRNLLHFDRLIEAIHHVRAKTPAADNLIFLHAGFPLLVQHRVLAVIGERVAIIGAAPGNVAKSVIVNSLFLFNRSAYLGYMTLRRVPLFPRNDSSSQLDHIIFPLPSIENPPCDCYLCSSLPA